MVYVGTIQGLREFLHSKVMMMLATEEYRNNPKEFGKLTTLDNYWLAKHEDLMESEATGN